MPTVREHVERMARDGRAAAALPLTVARSDQNCELLIEQLAKLDLLEFVSLSEHIKHETLKGESTCHTLAHFALEYLSNLMVQRAIEESSDV